MFLAHSSPIDRPDENPQGYAAHIDGAKSGAIENVTRMLKYAKAQENLSKTVECAAHWHDLGKLDPGNQAALTSGRQAKLPIDHIDAGVAHVKDFNPMAAWLIRAHHSPGLPRHAQELVREKPFRGVRNRSANSSDHAKLIYHVDSQIQQLVDWHINECGDCNYIDSIVSHGLKMRLALSCLVDADHDDSATYDRGFSIPDPPKPRWCERIEALDLYVEKLANDSKDPPGRTLVRNQFYQQCRNSDVQQDMVSCTGPVGIGKTTAVLAYLLQQAKKNKLRRIFVVAPFTNIIDQTVKKIREAVVLPGEDPEAVVAAHHNQTDFTSLETRAFATTWKSPFVVTTAVQFFETLASNRPGSLRKLNAVPGCAVFFDEAHAAIPVRLWPQNWKWLVELCNEWSCRFLFASGSLIEFWKMRKIVGDDQAFAVPGIDKPVIKLANKFEKGRIEYKLLPTALTKNQLVEEIKTASKPTLVILNTVQSAAVMARELRNQGQNVLQLSTALSPKDRKVILKKIERRLTEERKLTEDDINSKEFEQSKNWILVATSCIEAGVDLSFQTAFRESSSTSSVIQVGGRVNRHSERGNGLVTVFRLLKDQLINEHPDFKLSSKILEERFAAGDFDRLPPVEIATKAMKIELKQQGESGGESLEDAEKKDDYPLVAELGRVINSDTRMVVVDVKLIERLEKGDRPTFQEIQSGSVQLWSRKIASLGLESSKYFPGIFLWRGPYDREFLGIMDGLLNQKEFESSGFSII